MTMTSWIRELEEATCQVVRVLDLLSGGPRFKPFILLLTPIVLGYPEINSLAALCIWPNGLALAKWSAFR